jgi:squalene-associated FAD-dependent desaturase
MEGSHLANIDSRPHAVIVGGGLAGLAAATALADRGVRVTVLESRPRLGGRASSFTDTTTGAQIDNCQHVSMGCCTNFQKFCGVLGLSGWLQPQNALFFVGPDARVNRFSAGRLPAPLHLLSSFRRLSYLSTRDLWGIARGLRALVHSGAAASNGEDFRSWLARHGQTQAAVDRFWHVVLVSALSESLDRIAVDEARKVFVDAFLSHRRGWEVQIPTVPLDALYGERVVEWLGRRGGTVRLKTGARQAVLKEGAAVGVELRSGELVLADEMVIAVPHHLVLSLLPDSLAESLSCVEGLESAPITSVHLWFDRPITTLPHAVFVDRLSQWMFNRTLLQEGETAEIAAARSFESHPQTESTIRRAPPTGGRQSAMTAAHYYQIVISASRDLGGRTQESIIDEVVRELGDVWPDTRSAKLLHGRLVTEHKAVFSVTPGADAFRPPQQTAVANLQLAGDWTRTGWPATMEGAVRSGYLAAENVLAHLGRPERIVEVDLPVARLSRWLLGV